MSPALESTDAKNKLEDLSGVKIKPGENPYKALIEACHDDSVCVKNWTWTALSGVHHAIMDGHWLGHGHQIRAFSYTHDPVRVHC